MNIVAWGERTGLRPFHDPLSDSEIERVYRWSCDPEILKWSGGAPIDLSLYEFRERIRHESQNPPPDRRMFFIVTRAGELIGRIGCFAMDEHAQEGELGVVIGERALWNNGLGRDAITTMLRLMFETTPLARIHLYTYPENIRAQKCFAASGFRTLGIATRFSSDLGEFQGIEMEITRAEFFAEAKTQPLNIPVGERQV